MISENIRNLRNSNNLTQRELAEKLHVTAQAVSRWENGEVEPSIGTITSMAEIFNVTTDEIIGSHAQKKEKDVSSTKENAPSEYKPVLAICEQCNKPIYNGEEIVRKRIGGRTSYTKVLCKSCDEKNQKAKYEAAVAHGILQRKRAFLWGGLLSVIALMIALFISIYSKADTSTIIGASLVAILFFPFLSCLFLENNFIMDLFATISSWSIKMPGVIFSLDLDGLIWLLTVKLALWVLGGIFSIFCFLLALAVSLIMSIFVYPFAITKNFKHPELSISI